MTTAYISTGDLTTFYPDKDTATALAGGYLEFWQDSNRTNFKLVYEKQEIGADPVTGQPIYQYVPLPNPVTLLADGTPGDANGNPVVIYYYPYDANGDLDLYFIQVFSYLGVPQFSVEGWPSITATENPVSDSSFTENQLSNPQFAQVLFNTLTGLTIQIPSAQTQNIAIAPDWILNITTSGAGSVTIARNSKAGYSGGVNIPTNPPYTLTITPGANISALSLSQQLPNTPGIWSPQTSGIGGYVASNFLLGPNSPVVTMSYVPSTGAPTVLLSDSNSSAAYAAFTNTVQLPPSVNTSTADTGYVTISLTLSTNTATEISSLQVIGLSDDITGIAFEQETVNRQIDHLFNYYQVRYPWIHIPSYLVGWDFPLNPAQFLGASIAAQAVGANKSYYAWDQTIVFQSANSGLTISRDATGALKILAAQAGQHAIIQYLPAAIAIEMLSRRKCVLVSANASVATTATVSLWYTKTTLPSTIASNNSIVATLDANGYPATLNGTWVQVPRSGLNNNTTTANSTNAAQFTIPVVPSGGANFNHISLNGWDMQGNTDIESATYFAIVVGTASLAQNAYILYQAVSCQDGDIPSLPAPKSASATLSDCQQWYESSFPIGTVPAQNVGVGTGEQCIAALNARTPQPNLMFVRYRAAKVQVPTTLTTFNPAATNVQVRNETGSVDCNSTTTTNNTTTGFTITFVESSSSTSSGNTLGVHWVSDARLGA